MKALIISLLSIFYGLHVPQNEPIDRMGVKGPLTYNKTAFNLVYADKPNDIYFIQEYLPKGEQLDSYNQMMTIHLFVSNIDLLAAVKKKTNELIERQKTDEYCHYQVTEGPDGKEYIVDFILSDGPANNLNILEFNVYHYRQINLGKNKKGLAVYAYTKRSYGKKTLKFIETFQDQRLVHLNEMIATPKPTILLKG